MKEIVPNVYVETKYASGNVGFVVTQTGVICIDMPAALEDAQQWYGKIRSITDLPVLFLIQTDYDQQRAAGQTLLDVPVIAHSAAWERLRVYKNEKKSSSGREAAGQAGDSDEGTMRMPDITFSERLILAKGEQELHIIHCGGHSPATCMVHLPEHRLVFTGDLVYNNMHPLMTHAMTKEWLLALNQLRKMMVDLVVPGHGTVCDKEATYPLSDYIRDIRAKVRRHFQAERSKSETAATLITEFMDAFPYKESERERVRRYIKSGSDRIYDEYRVAVKTTPLLGEGEEDVSEAQSSGRKRRKRTA